MKAQQSFQITVVILPPLYQVHNETGTLLMSYNYDAWGSCAYTSHNGGSSTAAYYNPFRYRGYYYDSDLTMYYLNSRYYDQVTGRFISADDVGYLGANGDLNSYNMYAYCGNNPVMYVDHLGTYFNSILKKIINGLLKNCVDWLNVHALNKDGTYSLYDNDRFHDYTPWHEQILSVSGSNLSFDIKEGAIGLGSISIDLYTGGWETDYIDFSLIDIGHAEFSAEANKGNVNVGAFVSAWSPSFSVEIFDVKFEAGVEIGAVGGAINIGTRKISGTGAFGLGLSFIIDW